MSAVKHIGPWEIIQGPTGNTYTYHHHLEYVSENMKNNMEVVMAALKKDVYALHFASEHMKNNEEVVIAAIEAHLKQWPVHRSDLSDLAIFFRLIHVPDSMLQNNSVRRAAGI